MPVADRLCGSAKGKAKIIFEFPFAILCVPPEMIFAFRRNGGDSVGEGQR